MFIINALYFNQVWKYEFDETLTELKDFYVSANESIQTEMMRTGGDMQYYMHDKFQSIEIPYKDEHYSMQILLPNYNNTIEDIEEELSLDNWNSWQEQAELKEITLSLPKFKLAYKNKLNDELIDMGLDIPFTSAADFSGISNANLKISTVLQKTYIDVNEKGTEAAAVTSIGIVVTSVDPNAPININVNKPFLFFIKDNTSGTIAFMGKIENPAE